MTHCLASLSKRALCPKLLRARDLSSAYRDMVSLCLVDSFIAQQFGELLAAEAASVYTGKDIAFVLSAMSIIKMRHDYVHFPSLHTICNLAGSNAEKFPSHAIITTLNALKRFPKAVSVDVIESLVRRGRYLSEEFSEIEIHSLLDICGKIIFKGVSKEFDSFLTTLLNLRKPSSDLRNTIGALQALARQKTPSKDQFARTLVEFRSNFRDHALPRSDCLFLLHTISNRIIDIKEQHLCLELLIAFLQKSPTLHLAFFKDILVAVSKLRIQHRAICPQTVELFKSIDHDSLDDHTFLQVFASFLISGEADSTVLDLCTRVVQQRKFQSEKIKLAVAPFSLEKHDDLVKKIQNAVQKTANISLSKPLDVGIERGAKLDSHKKTINIGKDILHNLVSRKKSKLNLFQVVDFFENAVKFSSLKGVSQLSRDIFRLIDRKIQEESLSNICHIASMNDSQIIATVRFLTTYQLYSASFLEKILIIYSTSERNVSIAVDLEIVSYVGEIKGCISKANWRIILDRLINSVNKLDSFGVVRILVAAQAVQERLIVCPEFLKRILLHLSTVDNVGSTELAVALFSMNRLFINEPVLFNTILKRYLNLKTDHRSLAKAFASVSQYRYFSPTLDLVEALFVRVASSLNYLDHQSLLKIITSIASSCRYSNDVAHMAERIDSLTHHSRCTLVANCIKHCRGLKFISPNHLALVVLSLSKAKQFPRTTTSVSLSSIDKTEVTFLSKTTVAVAIKESSSHIICGSFLATLASRFTGSLNSMLSYERLAYNAFILYPFLVEKNLLDYSSATAAVILKRASELSWRIYSVDNLLHAFQVCQEYPLHEVPKCLLVSIYNELKERKSHLRSAELSGLHPYIERINSSGILSSLHP